MSFKECGACNRYFHNPDGFYRCWICLKKDRGWDLTKGDEVLDANLTAYDKIYRAHLSTPSPKRKRVIKKVITLDDLASKRLRQLLKLCHPDKHPSGKMTEHAHDVTSWLLAIQTHVRSNK